MRTLLRYEFRKLTSRKVFLLVSFVLMLILLIRFYLYCEGEKSAVPYDYSLYQEVKSAYSDLPYEDALERIRIDSDRMNIICMKKAYSDAGKSTDEIRSILSDLYEDQTIYEDILNDDANTSDLYEENVNRSSVLNILLSQYEYIASYDRFLMNLPARAEELKQVKIFSGEDSFAYRSIEKSLKDYGMLGDISITPDYDTGVLVLSGFEWSFVFTAALIFLACAILITDETDNHIMELQLSTKSGRLPLATAKWVVVILSALSISIILSGGCLIIAGTVLGFGDTERSLQSVMWFRNCCYSLKVRQWLLYVVLFQGFIAAVTATAILMFFSLLKKVWLSVIPISVWLSSEILFYRLIPDNAALNSLRFLNLSSLADPGKRFSTYENINLFGFPVSVLPTVFLTFTIAGTAFFVLYLISFSCNWQIRISGIRFPRKIRIRGTVRLSIQELYRFLVPGFGFLTLISLLIFSLSQLDYEEVRMKKEDYYYYQIGQMVTGEVNEGTYEKLLKARENFVMENDDVQIRQAAYERVVEEYSKLLSTAERGVPVHYISKVITDPLFLKSRHFLLFGLLLAVILSVSINPLFSEDLDTGLSGLIKTTKNGRAFVFRWRYFVMLTMYSVGFFGYIIPFLVVWNHRTHMNNWNAPIQSILLFTSCSGKMTIRSFILFWVVSSWVSGMVFPVLLSFLSQLIKRKSATLMASAVLTVSDFLVSILQYPFFSVLAVSGTYGLMQLLQNTGFVGIVFLAASKNLVLLIFLIWTHRNLYCR